MATIAISPEVESKISDGSHDGQGQACKFYFVGPLHGIKLYRRQEIRDNIYLLQKFFNLHGFCPKAYNKIDIGGKFGFVTELCDIMDTVSREYYEIVPDMPDSRYGEKIAYKKYSSAVYELEKHVQKTFPFIRVYDSHGGNFGFNYETSELQFVDVGHWEIQDYNGYWRRLEDMDTDELMRSFAFHGYELSDE